MDIPTLLQKLKPIIGEYEARQAWEQLQLADPKTAKLLEFLLRQKLAKSTGHSFEEKDILLEPIPKSSAVGPIGLGKVSYGKIPRWDFALRPEELIQHTAIFGRSGAGKTNVAFLLLRELTRQGVPFLVLDWKKNYRDLLPRPEFRDLVVYTVGREQAPFFFNPLVPPAGSEPREWLKKLIEVIQHAYFLGEGVAYVLQETLDRLYRDFGVYNQSKSWPTFRDLLVSLRSKPVKGREASWMESTLRAIGVLCFGAMDWTLNSGAHFPLEKLLKQKAVLELDALTNSDKTFLIESLLLWIHHHRMKEQGRETLKHVLLIEEAHHVLLKKKQELTGAEAVTDVILREVREFGEAIVLLDQLPSLISKPALENSFTTICMNLKEKGDVTAAAKAMLLESDETRYLGRLPVGSGIIKLQARWVKPFLVRFPLFSVKKGTVTDNQVKERFLHSLDVESVAGIMKESARAAARMLGAVGIKSKTRSQEKTAFTSEQMDFLRDVAGHVASTVTERYSRLGLNPKKGTKLVSDLIEQGFLVSSSVPIPGSHVRILQLSSTARQALELPIEEDRLGGPEHRYWIEKIAQDLLSAGIKVEKEAPLGQGKTVDLLITAGKQRIGIEVETGKSDWKRNLEKCLDASLNSVVVAATRRSVYRSLARKFRKDTLGIEAQICNASDVVTTILSKTRKRPIAGNAA